MKCPECNFENDDEANFCINCGSNLKISDIAIPDNSNESHSQNGENIDYPSSVPTTYSSEKLEEIFSENNFTIGQINKINSFIEQNTDESSIEKLINTEIANNEHHDELTDEEYELLLEFSKKLMADDLNGEGALFIQDNGSKTVTKTEMQTVKEEVPVVKQKHGALTKGAATLGFGLIGLAGTSGVKTEMKTVNKKVPIPVTKTVHDTHSVKLMVRNNRLELKHKDLKTIFSFNEIDEITQEDKFIYIKTNRETITLKRWNIYFSDLLTKSLSENIYYLKNYKAIKDKYIERFSKDLNDVWISEILAFNTDDNKPSEMDKIALIKEYHSLKESGIITEEEFNKKKQELLN